MMTAAATDKLYRRDAYLRRFEARVVAVEGPRVALDRTAFYAGGGGQPPDRGTLAGAAVVEVGEAAGGVVWHDLGGAGAAAAAAPLPATGAEVLGEVDWARRFDHMQQHTGQHVLSAAAIAVLGAGAETVSFHLGPETCTIDLARGPLSDAEVAAVEEAAQRVLFEDREVRVAFHRPDEAGALGLRKPPAWEVVGADLRVVTVDGLDVSACGGTHVRRTGEIGALKVVGQEKAKGRARLHFVCGWRAVRAHGRAHATASALAARLTCAVPELAAAVERLDGERRAALKDASALAERLEEGLAVELAVAAAAGLPPRVVARRLGPGDAGDPGRLAARVLALEPGAVLVLGETRDGRGQVVLARREGPVARAAPDLAAVLRAALAPLGGKGGGRPHFARGTVATEDLDRAMVAAASLARGPDDVQ